jgi:hypothetical protein
MTNESCTIRESKENLMHRNGMLIRPNQVYLTKKSKLKFVKKYKEKESSTRLLT